MMVKVITVLLMYLISFVGNAQNNNDHLGSGKKELNFTISVSVKNVSNDPGKVLFALYNSEKNFMERNPVKTKSSKILKGVSEVSFEGIAPGTYAVVCYHDSNSNGRLDFEQSGMPLEDYGSTNNVYHFGPPQFNDAKFELTDKDLTFEIKFM